MTNIKVTRELYPRDQQKLASINRIWTQAYAERTGTAMIEIRHDAPEDPLRVWRSEDNGLTWTAEAEIPYRESLGHGLSIWRSPGPLYLDADMNLLVRFWREQVVGDILFDYKAGYQKQSRGLIKGSTRMYYEISRDAGRTWKLASAPHTTGTDPDLPYLLPYPNWANPLRVVEMLPFPKLADGTILIPFQGPWEKEPEKYGAIQTGCLRARWAADAGDLVWEGICRIPGGGCEPALAELKDGRILCIMRLQGHIEPYFWTSRDLRPFSVSEDGGKTWAKPKPLMYTDGTPFASPRSMSHLIRSSRNGRLYWLANIVPASAEATKSALYKARADPRWPFQIVEVDEDSLALKKDTLTVIETKEPQEQSWTRFSNARIYEDRKTGESLSRTICWSERGF